MCHGFEDIYEDPVNRVSVQVGGFGLQLCREGLDLSNVHTTRALNGNVQNIVVFACSAAETYPGSGGDGRTLCSRLAANTGAIVYGADRPQIYRLHGLDFGRWEGNVYRFTPGGGIAIAESNPG
jgi:hypothetical protein